MPTLNTKKYLDANGITHLLKSIAAAYPDNATLQTVVDAVEEALDEKVDSADVGAAGGIASLDANGQLDSDQIPDDLSDHVGNTNVHLSTDEKQKLGTRVTAYRNASGTLVFSYGLPQ